MLKVYYDIQVITITFRSEAGADILRYVDYGDTLTDIPAVPEKPGFSGVWNVTDFSSVVAPFTVTAVYSAEYYSVNVKIVPEQVSVAGTAYDFYQFDSEDFSDMTASVQKDGEQPVQLDVTSSGNVFANLTIGTYTLTVTRGTEVRTKQITVSGNATDSIAFPKNIDLGGSVGDYASFNTGWEKLSENSVKISSYAYVYIGLDENELTDRYYLEADVDFKTSVHSSVFSQRLSTGIFRAATAAENTSWRSRIRAAIRFIKATIIPGASLKRAATYPTLKPTLKTANLRFCATATFII